MAESAVRHFVGHNVIPNETPGAPEFVGTPIQQGNRWLFDAVMPTQDALPNSPLTGLTHYNKATSIVVGGINPHEGLTGSEIKALGGFVTIDDVSPADAGTTKSSEVPVLAGDVDQVISIWVDDD